MFIADYNTDLPITKPKAQENIPIESKEFTFVKNENGTIFLVRISSLAKDRILMEIQGVDPPSSDEMRSLTDFI